MRPNREVQVNFLTHSGLVWRWQRNQDALLVGEYIYQKSFTRPAIRRFTTQNLLLALGDGVAISPCAALASRRAMRLLYQMHQGQETFTPATIRRVQQAFAESAEGKKSQGMATTLAGLWFNEQTITIFNAGDSRVYRLRDGSLTQMSRDHTLVAQWIREGRISAEQANEVASIYFSLESCLVADHEGEGFEIFCTTQSSLSGDRWLVCSDGLTDMLQDEEIERILESCSEDSSQAVRALFDAAMKKGGEDNCSLILVDIGPCIQDNAPDPA